MSDILMYGSDEIDGEEILVFEKGVKRFPAVRYMEATPMHIDFDTLNNKMDKIYRSANMPAKIMRLDDPALCLLITTEILDNADLERVWEMLEEWEDLD